jgi:hypothetical protein
MCCAGSLPKRRPRRPSSVVANDAARSFSTSATKASSSTELFEDLGVQLDRAHCAIAPASAKTRRTSATSLVTSASPATSARRTIVAGSGTSTVGPSVRPIDVLSDNKRFDAATHSCRTRRDRQSGSVARV